jgi:hypothetical protein
VVPDDDNDAPLSPPVGVHAGRLHAILADKLQPSPLVEDPGGRRARTRSNADASPSLPPVGLRRTAAALPRKRNHPQHREWRVGPFAPVHHPAAGSTSPSGLGPGRGKVWDGGAAPDRAGDFTERAMTAAIRHRRMLRPLDETRRAQNSKL